MNNKLNKVKEILIVVAETLELYITKVVEAAKKFWHIVVVLILAISAGWILGGRIVTKPMSVSKYAHGVLMGHTIMVQLAEISPDTSALTARELDEYLLAADIIVWRAVIDTMVEHFELSSTEVRDMVNSIVLFAADEENKLAVRTAADISNVIYEIEEYIMTSGDTFIKAVSDRLAIKLTDKTPQEIIAIGAEATKGWETLADFLAARRIVRGMIDQHSK